MVFFRRLCDLLKKMKSNDVGNRRGAEFEFASMMSLNPIRLLECRFDFSPPNISPKDLDLYFDVLNCGLELYSPSRVAVPISDISESASDEEAQRVLFDNIRTREAQGETLCMVVASKLRSKNIQSLVGPIILLIDTFNNDYIEDYFYANHELNISSLKNDFLNEAQEPSMNGIFTEKILVGVVKRSKHRYQKIYIIYGADELTRNLKRIFLSKVLR